MAAEKSARGRFVWHELMTPDTQGAHAFYTKVIGWKTQPWEQEPSYVMFVAASGPLGGTFADESGSPQWLPYIGTEDIEGTVSRAKELGARVVKDVTGMPNGGKFAVLTDPQGASFGVYVSASPPGPEKPAKRGEFSWHELATSDYQAAFKFYSAVFGWQNAGEHDMGAPLGTYFMFGRGGGPIGGMFNLTPDMPGPAWMCYVRVKDVQQAVKKAKSAGGKLLNGPMEVPGGDWIAQFADPQGAMFAVHTLAADLQGAKAAAAPSPQLDLPVEAPANEAASAQAAQSPSKKKAATSAKSSPAPAKKAAKKAGKKSAGKTAQKTARKAAKKSAKKAAKKAAKAGRRAKAAGRSKATRAPARKKASGKSARRSAAKTKQSARAKKSAKKARRGK